MNHLKTIAAPRTWKLNRKKSTFTLKPNPSGHRMELCMPLGTLIRQLGFASTAKEARHILNTQEVLLDGKKVKSQDMAVGFMDVVGFPAVKKWYRMHLNSSRFLEMIEIDQKEAAIKPCKIKNKTTLKGKIQLNLSDGKNILVEKSDYKTGDSILIEVENNKIRDHFPLTKGCSIIVTSGKNTGSIGKIERIEQNKVFYKDNKGEVKETVKKYTYVIGKEKPEIKLS